VLQLEAGQTFKIEHTFSNFSPSTFLSFVEEARKSYAIAILGGNLTSDVSGGSHAAATVHQDILEEMVSADTQRLAKELNKITNLLLFFNKQQSDAHLKWDFNENEDTLQTLSILKQIQEITNQTVDIEPFLERWNIKINK
jgi:phage gp29-like protein